ncbi:sigma-54-dependent transcriptional regulator [Solilutibacter silvestris]|uniref:Response regulator consisting of a CheY-like receiver domain and a winged-helix DNA-binding domain n=1 Tax=Solilutibacter silvestris TaxID=1645665 RepID=A0A2K1Q2P6_9GAMM|nr:sigma-54 dependent transcriptional regulator [Lysobacter silvestris]PNS09315.1 Response regulator consisting of a CheY-like receiver domain and a winged-helix DNA-binding domain [Lysobacter silvestris]
MADTQSALVVDDERDIRELLVVTLTRMGLRVETAATVSAARSQLASHEFDFCLTDMRLPDGSGMDLITHIAATHPGTPVAMITAFGNVEAAVEALKRGAFDFVSKPVDLHILRELVRNALRLRSERETAHAQSPAGRMLGQSPAMQALRQTIDKVARSQAPVYIHGESGSGKELVARTIHQSGPRANGSFVPVNCGAIPAELMESEFFGHRKGSFTGAHADKEGLFQAANGGTLFLDEVAELPLAMQVKLLRAIQEKSVRPVGGQAEQQVDVRILSATHKDLATLVEQGGFRHDLYYRINVIELRVPPLRERSDDLPILCNAILARLAERHGLATPPSLSDDALAALRDYPFPGNIRELENTLERAMTLADGELIHASDLRLPQGAVVAASVPAPEPQAVAAPATTTVSAPMDVAAPSANGDLTGAMEQLERAAIEKALLENRYNKTKTAAALGITFRALRYKLKKLGME